MFLTFKLFSTTDTMHFFWGCWTSHSYDTFSLQLVIFREMLVYTYTCVCLQCNINSSTSNKKAHLIPVDIFNGSLCSYFNLQLTVAKCFHYWYRLVCPQNIQIMWGNTLWLWSIDLTLTKVWHLRVKTHFYKTQWMFKLIVYLPLSYIVYWFIGFIYCTNSILCYSGNGFIIAKNSLICWLSLSLYSVSCFLSSMSQFYPTGGLELLQVIANVHQAWHRMGEIQAALMKVGVWTCLLAQTHQQRSLAWLCAFRICRQTCGMLNLLPKYFTVPKHTTQSTSDKQMVLYLCPRWHQQSLKLQY